MAPKVGRPTDNPKGKSVHVRLDEKSEEILNRYTTEKNISRAEAIREVISLLAKDLKK